MRLGVMGGTFDPVHHGHLVAASEASHLLGLDEVVFVPTGKPYKKDVTSVSPAEHRYLMTVLATTSNPHFDVSSIEMDRPGPSYTIDTIYELRRQYGENTDLFFITGADAIAEIPTWDRIEELLGLCQFIAATRPGFLPNVDNIKEYFGELGSARIHRLETPELEISSTNIRDRLKRGFSIKYIVPPAVEDYIYKEGLYK